MRPTKRIAFIVDGAWSEVFDYDHTSYEPFV